MIIIFNQKEMYIRLKNSPYFEYLSLKDNYEDTLRGMTKEEQMDKWKKQTELLKPYMEKYDNPYININHIQEKLLYSFVPGDEIVIQEKIDGSNAHLIVSSNGFEAFGMNYKLNEYNHLQGFFYWCQNNYKKIPNEYFNFKFYGEWLTPHHCDYKDEYYCNFYVFDIMVNNKYLPQEQVEKICKECNLDYVPVFYKGKFESWKQIKSFIGKTNMGTGKGEGIVIKNMSKLNKADKLFYLKLVDKEYQETNPCRDIVKTITDETLEKADNLANLVSSIVTMARIRKQILKMVDVKLLPFNWNQLDTNKIVKLVKNPIIKDCYKEERDIVDNVGKRFSSYANSLIINYIEELKKEK